jgi:hypothetical protein
MDAIPLALDGYLAAEAEPGDREGTVSWRLTCSAGTDHLVEEAVIPCTTMEPEIAHALLTERQPGDLLRVTGHLTLPHTADGIIRLHAESLEVLWEAPVLDADRDDTDTATDADADRNRAIAALAEALTGFGQATPGPRAEHPHRHQPHRGPRFGPGALPQLRHHPGHGPPTRRLRRRHELLLGQRTP